MNQDLWLQTRHRARLQYELDELAVEAEVIALRLDQVAKELDDLTIELKVAELAKDYPDFEKELQRELLTTIEIIEEARG
jgi:hypothetical protein